MKKIIPPSPVQRKSALSLEERDAQERRRMQDDLPCHPDVFPTHSLTSAAAETAPLASRAAVARRQ
jgi:hypothetical protein